MAPSTPASTRSRRWRQLAAATVAALAFGWLPSIPSAAAVDDPQAQKSSIDAELEQLRQDLLETEATLAAAFLDLKTTEAKLPGAQSALSVAQAAVDQAAAEHAAAEQDLQVAQANEAKAEEELAATTAQIDKEQAAVAGFAGQLYMDSGVSGFDVAAMAEDPEEYANRLGLVDAIMDSQQQSLGKLATAKASHVALESQLTALRQASQDAEERAQQALTASEAARDSAATAKTALDDLLADQQAQHALVQSKLEGQREREAQMQAESDRLSAILAERAREALAQGGSGGSVSGSGFLWPLPGGYVTSEYGPRVDPINGIASFHNGLDIASVCGSPIVAAAAGTVVMAGPAGGYGNRVVVDHGVIGGNHLATSYSHLQAIAAWGGSVSQGQVVGYEGTTGWSTGCHLHFEVFVNGVGTNPRGWL